MKEKKKIFRGIGIQIDRTRKTLVRRERLVVCIGCIKWTEKNKKKKTAMMPSTSTISVYVSTFFNYRVAASLWQRDETTAKLDEARPPLESAIHAIFCALPITKIVCVCVFLRVPIRVRASFAYSPFVTSSLLYTSPT